MAAYSLGFTDAGNSRTPPPTASKLVAEKYAVSRAGVDRLKPRLPAQLPRLAILIREQPDRTLVEWQQAPTSASLQTIWRAVTKLGCRGARDRTRPAGVAEARGAWQQNRPDLGSRAARLDESGGRTDLVRRYGRGQRGERVVDHTPDRCWHTTTLLAALRVTGLTAPAVFDGPIDGVSFLAYEQVLAPTLRPGDVVVLDNLSVHRSPAVRDALFSPEVQPRPESD